MSLSGLSSSIELLESRIAPAGVVTLDFDKFGYVLTGDAAANDLRITQDGNEITIVPQNGTQILNKLGGDSVPSDATLGIVMFLNRLSIDMGGGADVLTLQDLSLPGDLRIDTGFNDNLGTNDLDTVEISRLRVAGNLTVNAWGGAFDVRDNIFYVGGNADIFSSAHTFTTEVNSFFVGGNFKASVALGQSTDRFSLNALSFIVYNNFDFAPDIFAVDAPADAISMEISDLFNVGGSFHVAKSKFGNGSLTIDVDVMDVTGKLFIDNQSADKSLNFNLSANALQLHSGITVASKSTAPTTVDAFAELVKIDGPVSVKLPKSAGELSIVANNLFIKGNVNLVTGGTGNLRIEGPGDILGKISATLGNGSGEVSVKGGVGFSRLFFNGLKVTTPAKLPASAVGANITVDAVRIFGPSTMLLGPGADTVNMNDGDFFGPVFVSTGNGNDLVNLHTTGSSDSVFYGGAGVALGNGDDILTLGKVNVATAGAGPTVTFFGPKAFDGGSGNDTYVVDGRNVEFLKSPAKPVQSSPLVRNFEIKA
ncbi:hypothetical protein ACXR0O_16735 [Verrucomicrobiota bacterium sgz303538]